MAKLYRYPGAQPFQTNESHVFYGRDGVSQDLYQLIRLEPLVVLHAKSGLGKSSLINAGLMPIIEKAKEYEPFNIRFHAYTDGKTETPLDITRTVVHSKSDLLEKIRPTGDDSLWYHLKSLQLAAADDHGLLLIFDQFEELFTYRDLTVEEFARQLSEALYTTLPQRYRDKRKAGFEKDKNFLSDQELALLDQPLNLRLLMAIRSDRMSLMKKAKAYFPTILSADFELQPLNREQAEDAILSPAYQKGNFVTPIFDYEDDGIEYLLDFLSEGGTEPIESFQLQILCEYVEHHIVAKQGKDLIEKEDIANPDEILENYYLDKITSITDPKDQLAARRLIEEGFIFEEEERRLTLYEGQIFKSYGISQELLNELLDTHLIRSEPSLRGGYTYELSHDTLVAPVLKAKGKRKNAERLIREKEELQAREEELLALRKKEETSREQAEKEKQLRTAAEGNEKRARQRTRLATVVSVLALLLSGLAFWFWRNAEESNRISSLKTEQALEANIATNNALAAAELRKVEADTAAARAERQRVRANESEELANSNAKIANKNLLQANKRFASYLGSEAEKAFEVEDIRLAYRLVEAAEQYDKDNEKVITLKKSIPNYASRFFIRAKNYKLSPDGKFLTFFIKEKEGKHDVLEVLNLSNTSFSFSFENCHSYLHRGRHSDTHHYSSDGKFLIFYTKGKTGKYDVLQVLDLSKTSSPRSFENSYHDLENYRNYTYSPNGKFLTFYTKGKLGYYDELQVLDLSKDSSPRSFENCYHESKRFRSSFSYSSDGKFLTFYTKGKTGNYDALQVLDLSKASPPRSFENSKGYKYSSDGKFLTFFTKGKTEEYGVLQVLDLSKASPPRSFENSYHNNKSYRSSYTYSSDEKFLTFYTKGKTGNYDVLQVLDLSKTSLPRSFENCYNESSRRRFRYSPDGKFLTFFTKGKSGNYDALQVLDLSKTSPPRSFENSDNESNNYYNYSPDGNFLTFYTKGKTGDYDLLQVLDLSKTSPPRSFENCYHNSESYGSSYSYSSDGNFLTFFTKGEAEKYDVLQVLDLSKASLPRSFENSDSYRYSSEGNFLTFFTKGKTERYDVLQILDLSKVSPPNSFENCNTSTNGHRFNLKENFLTFYTKGKTENYDVLQVLDLSKASLPRTFESSYGYGNSYSPDGRFLAFFTIDKDYNVLYILELESGKIRKSISHKYEPRVQFLNNNNVLTTSENPFSKEKIYKIIDLSLGNNNQAFEYYKKYFYTPLTKEEKKSYGIID